MNIIVNPYFELSTQANRGATARERRAGVAGLLDLHATTDCKWTATSTSSDLGDIHGVHLVWDEATQTYDAKAGRKNERRLWGWKPAEIIPFATLRARREELGDAADHAGAVPPAA